MQNRISCSQLCRRPSAARARAPTETTAVERCMAARNLAAGREGDHERAVALDHGVGELGSPRERAAAAPVELELAGVEQCERAVDLDPAAAEPRRREREKAVRSVAAEDVEPDDARLRAIQQ